MAKHTQDDLIYYATLNNRHKEALGKIRLWDLKLAYDGDIIWIKGLNEAQIQSKELLSIPNCSFYVERENKLYPKGSILPCANVPSLLWTPIQLALPLTLPKYNDNFVILEADPLDVSLIKSDREEEAFALLATVADLEKYIQTAPAIRLKKLEWTLLSEQQALIIGTPLLPIKGNVFWRYKQLLLPAGFKLNYEILADYINDSYTTNDMYLCWLEQHKAVLIDLNLIEQLSVASFRKTFEK